MLMSSRRKQRGSFMLEALIAEVSNLVDQMLGQINLNSRDNVGLVNAVTLASFSHQPAGGVGSCRLADTDPLAASDCCNFTGLASANALVTDWVAAVSTDAATRIPGSTAARQQIVVNAGASNQVTITVCWQGPKDTRPRFHRVIGYVN
jgi:hypothetical protein